MRITWKLFGARSSKRALLSEREALIAFTRMSDQDQVVMAQALITADYEFGRLKRAS